MAIPAHFNAASLVNAAGLISHPQNENVREAHDALLVGAELIRQQAARIEALELGLQRLMDAPKLGTHAGMRRAREAAQALLSLQA